MLACLLLSCYTVQPLSQSKNDPIIYSSPSIHISDSCSLHLHRTGLRISSHPCARNNPLACFYTLPSCHSTTVVLSLPAATRRSLQQSYSSSNYHLRVLSFPNSRVALIYPLPDQHSATPATVCRPLFLHATTELLERVGILLFNTHAPPLVVVRFSQRTYKDLPLLAVLLHKPSMVQP